jgi:hypothetical protein
MLPCIGAAMGPAVGCRPAETCCRWYLVTTGSVVAVGVVMEATAAEAIAAKALALEALALASEEHLWLVVTQLVLLSPS